MCGINDGCAALLALLLEEVEEVEAAKYIHVDGDLVEEKYLVRLQEAHADLHAAALAV